MRPASISLINLQSNVIIPILECMAEDLKARQKIKIIYRKNMSLEIYSLVIFIPSRYILKNIQNDFSDAIFSL